MKGLKQLFSLLLMVFVIGVGNVWGATKTEGFEAATTGTNYQSTVDVESTSSDCGISWNMYYGCVTTSSKISGANSVGLRLYTTENYGFLKTTTAIEGLSNVAFSAKAATSNGADIKVDIFYSANGADWTSIETGVAIGATAGNYNYDIPSGGKYFQIAISSTSTRPSTKNAQLTIDDVVFTYDGGDPDPEPSCSTPTITFAEESVAKMTTDAAFTNAASVEYESTATGQAISWSVEAGKEGVATVNATTGEVTIVGVGEAKIYASVAAEGDYCEKSAYYTLTVTEPAFECGAGSTEFAFGDHAGFSSLTSSYANYTFEYTEANVVCAGVAKQGSTITDCPVTKGGAMEVKANNGRNITSIHFEFKQWTTKAQTATLSYSTDGGENYSAFKPAISSADFELTCASLPANTNAVKVTFSSSSNQIGLVSICAVYTDPVAPSVATPELSVAAGTFYTAQNVKVSNYDAALSYFYTLDGTAPTNASAAYNNAAGIDVAASATLKVIAYDAESNASEVASVAYVIVPTYASLEELVAAGAPTADGATVRVSFTDEEINSLFVSGGGKRQGVFVLSGSREVEFYCSANEYPETWAAHGHISATNLEGKWTLYKSTTWELVITDWTGFSYTPPSAEPTTPEYANLQALLDAEGEPTTGGKDVIVSFENQKITKLAGGAKGIYMMVGEQEIEIYCNTANPADPAWETRGLVSATELAASWKKYNSTWELVITDWSELSYTAPAPLVVTGIEVTTNPTKTTYAIGESLDLAGAVVTATYSDASTDQVNLSDVEVSGFDSSTEGNKMVTLTYQGQTASFQVTIDADIVPTFVTRAIVAPMGDKYYAATTSIENKKLPAVEVCVANGAVYYAGAEDIAWLWDEENGIIKNTSDEVLSAEGSTKTNVEFSSASWSIDGTNGLICSVGGTRALFSNGSVFGYYATSNIGKSGYSEKAELLPIVKGYGRNVTTGKIGTICLPNNVTGYTGATFYSIAYKEEKEGHLYKIYFDEATTLEAGVPYIFEATSDVIALTYGSTTADATSHNGLVGTLTGISPLPSDGENIYVISDNKVRKVAAVQIGDGVSVGANRAYINAADIPSDASALAPGRKRISLGSNETNVATDLEAISGGDTIEKLMIDGVIYIRRGEKLYDVTGRLVK